MGSLEELQKRFAGVTGVRFDAGNGGLTRIVVHNDSAEAHVYLHGAHMTHYQTRGHGPVLMLSERSHFQAGKPIRGGVPICFPWFSMREEDPSAPLHGFVRLSPWHMESIRQDQEYTVLLLSTRSDENTLRQWPHEFVMRYEVRVGPTLDLAMTVENTGDQPMTFEEALHTYYAVSDVAQVALTGLKGAHYLDKHNNLIPTMQEQDPIVVNDRIDRVYVDTQAACVISDPPARRTITITKRNSNSTVVWCPWLATIQTFADLGEGQWRHMLCVETCNVKQNAVTLVPGQSHTMSLSVRVDSLR